MNKIEQLLKKRGIEDVTELNEEEKVTYKRLQEKFIDGEVTVEKIEQFCHRYKASIEQKWREFDVSSEKKSELIPYHTFCSAIIGLITSSEAKRKEVEYELDSLLNK